MVAARGSLLLIVLCMQCVRVSVCSDDGSTVSEAVSTYTFEALLVAAYGSF